MLIKEAKKIIEMLELTKLPFEGGYYRRTYISKEEVSILNRTSGYKEYLHASIYYLITSANFSAMHILNNDEFFHFYKGSPCEIFLIYHDGKSELVKLGNDIEVGQVQQCFVHKATWQGLRVVDEGSYSLLGTTTSPAYDQRSFRLGSRSELIGLYPQYTTLIKRYTYGET